LADSKSGKDRPTIWVHVFEKDTPEGAVYLPEDADIPLSRRPRERIELGADGKATLFVPGPDDRFIPQPARWSEEGDEITVRDVSDAVKLRIVERSADRLVVKVTKKPNPAP
jgi:hypothetical protein